MPKPIARVLAGDEPPIILILGCDLRWTCERFPELADACNLLTRGWISCEWAGKPGYAAAVEVAKIPHGWIEYSNVRHEVPAAEGSSK